MLVAPKRGSRLCDIYFDCAKSRSETPRGISPHEGSERVIQLPSCVDIPVEAAQGRINQKSFLWAVA
jgi:hypothetical protein